MNFLCDRRQRVKVGQHYSDWLEVWGTVPQGTLLGVLCFICMINDLQTDCTTLKYVDDTTVYQVTNNPSDPSLQTAIDTAISWSKANRMNINPTKTKEMLITFAKNKPDVPNITIAPIERVQTCTLLGIDLNDQLSWDNHVEKIYKKASSRLHFVSQLKRTRMSSEDMVRVFVAIVRPLVEYACQLWHAGLTESQVTMIESVQVRALNLAYPMLSYEEALVTTGLPTLQTRRKQLCESLFADAEDKDHRLHQALPPPRKTTYSTRNPRKYPLPNVKTERYKDSFIPYCLFNNF